MSQVPSTPKKAEGPQHFAIWAGILSYLIPGLGQICQGRVGKGVMFMVCLLSMFFVGQAMGDWKNVYIPETAEKAWMRVLPRGRGFAAGVVDRWHYAGQFWIGIAAWPAIWQFNRWPLPLEESYPFLKNLQKAPQNEMELNEYLANRDKIPDLAWVYTVVAGMLNILVIYDAFAGPAYGNGRGAFSGVDPKENEPLPA